MKVSVIVLCYNHEKYIAQCLESIIDQNFSESYEILVGDDCSTDGSREIIDDFKKKYPELIVEVFPNRNLGPNPNYLNCYSKTKGKYIAFCEGDDYWIDKHKLQKQVDFLQNNQDYGGVCTNNSWLYADSGERRDSVLEEGIITFEKLTKSNVINSQSTLFRKDILKDLSWLSNLKIGDWPLHLILTAQKPYYRLPEIMTLYRVHGGGIHSQLKQTQKLKNILAVQQSCLSNLTLTTTQLNYLRLATIDTLKKLLNTDRENVKLYRNLYLKLGGKLLNKSFIKSFL